MQGVPIFGIQVLLGLLTMGRPANLRFNRFSQFNRSGTSD